MIYGGDKVFAAGADVKEFAGMSHADMVRDAERLSSSFDVVARLPKPVVAAVTGYALGGGCELALAADFRVSADDARWGQPEILLGIIPGGGGTQRLPRLIGPAKAKDLIYTGRFVPADEALEIGLVDVVVPAAEVYATAVKLAAKFATGPALALRAAKAAIDGGMDADLASGLRLESHLFASLFATSDRTAGMSSFIERGPGRAVFLAVDLPVTKPSAQPPASPAEIEAAWSDPKLANVLYHDWEAQTYDQKWSISFDQRCIDYARDRFEHIAGRGRWPYRTALEVGCGTGFFILNLMLAGVIDTAPSTGHVTDVSPGMVEAARRNAESLGFQVAGRVADAERLPFDDATFELVVGHAVLHHIPDVEQALREVIRVLKPGGRFVFAGEPTKWRGLIAGDVRRDRWAATRHPAARREAWGAGTRTRRVVAGHGPGGRRGPAHVRPQRTRPDGARAPVPVDVEARTEELTAAWLGWPVRTFEHAVPPGKLGFRLGQLRLHVVAAVVPRSTGCSNR